MAFTLHMIFGRTIMGSVRFQPLTDKKRPPLGCPDPVRCEDIALTFEVRGAPVKVSVG